METFKNPCVNEWIMKTWYVYTTEFYSPIRKNEILTSAHKWFEVENIVLSEVKQTQKDKGHIFFHLWFLDPNISLVIM